MIALQNALQWMATALAVSCCSCSGTAQQKTFNQQVKMPKPLKEISGITQVGKQIWAISDKPNAVVFRLNTQGTVEQEVQVQQQEVNDVEAITSDGVKLYIGDVGDNNGNRLQRKIIVLDRSAIPPGARAQASGQAINFTFAGDDSATGKKENAYDCEALLAFKDSLYLFTKERNDDYSGLFVLPKTPGSYKARLVSRFDTNGLITDAAINPAGNEVALVGYEDGHRKPFVLLFSGFKGNDFFSGKMSRYPLKGNKEWQIEGVTYGSDNFLYLSCEQTKDVPATLYGIEKQKL